MVPPAAFTSAHAYLFVVVDKMLLRRKRNSARAAHLFASTPRRAYANVIKPKSDSKRHA